jgi:hypothetical protein
MSMTVPQDRDPLAAARRVGIGDAGRDAVQRELDLRLWDMRLAAVLNTMEIARAHGEHRDWTSEHSSQIRAMMAIADDAVAGDGGAGVVPQGFGAPVRARLALTFIQAQARRDKTGEAEPAAAAGDPPP